jgi:hypothetical protein
MGDNDFGQPEKLKRCDVSYQHGNCWPRPSGLPPWAESLSLGYVELHRKARTQKFADEQKLCLTGRRPF